ncbi:MAG: hypothetical protein R3E72_13055, partial [Steroidobacteraceae bacterium]
MARFTVVFSPRIRAQVERRRALVLATFLAVAGAGTPAAAQPAGGAVAPPPPPTWRMSAVNLTRLESWRFFDPRPGGGDPDYAFLGDRLRLDLRGHWPRADLTLAAQVVGMAGLPDRAVGPGAL